MLTTSASSEPRPVHTAIRARSGRRAFRNPSELRIDRNLLQVARNLPCEVRELHARALVKISSEIISIVGGMLSRTLRTVIESPRSVVGLRSEWRDLIIPFLKYSQLCVKNSAPRSKNGFHMYFSRGAVQDGLAGGSPLCRNSSADSSRFLATCPCCNLRFCSMSSEPMLLIISRTIGKGWTS